MNAHLDDLREDLRGLSDGELAELVGDGPLELYEIAHSDPPELPPVVQGNER